MAVSTFAAIEIGSYALEMKIYEISGKGQIKEINRVYHVIELGKESYNFKKIRFEIVDEVCDILSDFRNIMKEYGVKDYRAFVTSAVREAMNCQNILDRISIRTGLQVSVLSNAELRFTYSKAVALKDKKFNELINDGTMMIDVGGGSMQLTIYDKGHLVSTHNVKLGAVRLREMMSRLKVNPADYLEVLEEFVESDIKDMLSIFFQNIRIRNMIATGDYVTHILTQAEDSAQKRDMFTRKEVTSLYDKITTKSHGKYEEYVEGTNIPVGILVPSAVIYKKIVDIMEVENIWVPKVKLCDGMVAEYAEETKKLKVNHPFQEDIVYAAWVIAKRYLGNEEHLKLVEESALMVFDEMKKYHGLSGRERLLLQIAAILHDTGKYIGVEEQGESCYNVIIGTEIIGLSRLEQMIVANIARYNTDEFEYEDILQQGMNQEMGMVILKLTAILRICNALDRTHGQKCKKLKVSLNKKELVLTTQTFENMAIEKGMFEDKAGMFEDVYGITPVLKVKRG